MKRNPQVELSRLIACFIVIGCHTYLSMTVNGSFDAGRTFIACLFADGVAIFWIITGFYLFNNKSYLKLWKRTLFKVIIPMLVLGVVLFYFAEFILGHVSLAENIAHPLSDYVDICKSLIKLENPFPFMDQTWYVYAYILVILAFPVLKAFADYMDKSVKREICFLAVTFGLFLINDITKNSLLCFSHQAIHAFLAACVEVMWGHIIFNHKDIFEKKRFAVISVCSFFVLNLLRLGIEMLRTGNGGTDTSILYWFSTIGLLCGVAVVVFGFSVMDAKKETKPAKVFCFLASFTYPIYLIHCFVLVLLNSLNVQAALQAALVPADNPFFGELIYAIVLALITFAITLAVCIVIRLIKKGFYLLIKSLKRSEA